MLIQFLINCLASANNNFDLTSQISFRKFNRDIKKRYSFLLANGNIRIASCNWQELFNELA